MSAAPRRRRRVARRSFVERVLNRLGWHAAAELDERAAHLASAVAGAGGLGPSSHARPRHRARAGLTVARPSQHLPHTVVQRSFQAGAVDRLTADWFTPQRTGDADLRGPLRRMIARARDTVQNNDYALGFLADVETNVIGAAEVDLRMDAHDMLPGGVKRPDELANRQIQDAWREWNAPENASLNGQWDWRQLKRLAIRAVPTDGAVLYRYIRGTAARNRFGFALQLFEIDQLDFDRNYNLPDGGSIRFGVEKDADERLRAFHLFRNHPGEDFPQQGNREVLRIPATEMRLLQLPFRITQTLGVTWFHAALTRLRHLAAYEEAEVIAARVAACKGGFFKTIPEQGPGYPPPADGQQFTVDAEPGAWEQLPPGLEPIVNDPQHPNTAFGEFRKAMIRGIATGLGVSYTTLGNDLESVNYSSARVGLLDEREVWKQLQLWFQTYFLQPVFGEWLLMALTSGALNLPLAKYDKFNAPVFKQRRWPWIDPLKDIQASILSVQNGFTSRTAVVEEGGGDFAETCAQQKQDKATEKKNGLDLAAEPAPTTAASASAAAGTPKAVDEPAA